MDSRKWIFIIFVTRFSLISKRYRKRDVIKLSYLIFLIYLIYNADVGTYIKHLFDRAVNSLYDSFISFLMTRKFC